MVDPRWEKESVWDSSSDEEDGPAKKKSKKEKKEKKSKKGKKHKKASSVLRGGRGSQRAHAREGRRVCSPNIVPGATVYMSRMGTCSAVPRLVW